MRAYRIDSFGSVDGVVLGSRDDPRPGTREILLRVRATSLNYRDLMVLKGGGRGPTKLGVVPLSDGAGEVVAVGDGVSRFAVGDRVIGCFHPRWFGGPIKADYLTDRLGANLDGMLAEYAVVSEEAAVAMPSHLSFEEAATLPCAAVIDYIETPEWHAKVAELTGGRGVDCVVEIGGPDTLANSIKSLAVGGHISLIGSSLSRSGIMLDPLSLGGRGMSLGSISVGSRADFDAMNRAIAKHRLRPVIDRAFPFDAAQDAYRHFESRAHFGKVVINHG